MSKWLTGKSVGFKGPWGTTYPGNIRHFMSRMSVDHWIRFVHRWHGRPPMPVASVKAMSNADLRAVYAFVRTLKPIGPRGPHNLHPGQQPHTPYIDLTPKQPDS